jgi:hypothetical protein
MICEILFKKSKQTLKSGENLADKNVVWLHFLPFWLIFVSEFFFNFPRGYGAGPWSKERVVSFLTDFGPVLKGLTKSFFLNFFLTRGFPSSCLRFHFQLLFSKNEHENQADQNV